MILNLISAHKIGGGEWWPTNICNGDNHCHVDCGFTDSHDDSDDKDGDDEHEECDGKKTLYQLLCEYRIYVAFNTFMTISS